MRTSEPQWVYCGGEAWKEIKTVLDGKFIADADRSSESQQLPRVCSSPPPSLNVELGPDLLAAFQGPWAPGHLFQPGGRPLLPKDPIRAMARSLPPLRLPPGHTAKVGRLHLGGFRTLDRGSLSISGFSAKPPLGSKRAPGPTGEQVWTTATGAVALLPLPQDQSASLPNPFPSREQAAPGVFSDPRVR